MFLASKNNEFLDLVIKGDSKIVINRFDKKSNLASSIMLQIDDVWRLSHNLNIYKCRHILRKANKT